MSAENTPSDEEVLKAWLTSPEMASFLRDSLERTMNMPSILDPRFGIVGTSPDCLIQIREDPQA